MSESGLVANFGLFLRKVDQFVRRTSARSLFWATIALDTTLLSLILLVAVVPTQARFVSEGRTQLLSLKVPEGGRMLGWGNGIRPSNVFIPEGCSAPIWSMPRIVEGPFALKARTSKSGGLTITLTSDDGSAFGELECGDEVHEISGEFVAQWDADDAKGLMLPLSGQLVLGDDVTSGMSDQKLLLSGTIKTYTIGSLGGSVLGTNERELYRGDRVFFIEEAGKTPISYALLNFNDNAIEFSAQTQASEVRVVHFGQIESAAEVVSPGFLARLQAHSLWGVLALVGATILHMFSAVRDYIFERSRFDEEQLSRLPTNDDE